MHKLDFIIEQGAGPISHAFSTMGIKTFAEAAKWVNDLDYRRNSDKNNVLCLFTEHCGTCSTKHALLKRLANENGHNELRLMLAIFAMNALNTPALKEILEKYKLDYIPEAHNFLRTTHDLLDYTGIPAGDSNFALHILTEIEVQPEQITDFKVDYHREYLRQWIIENQIPYSLDELWSIREECIKALTLARLSIETERLFLRPFRKEDGAAMYELNDDPEVLQYTGDVQFENMQAVETFLENYSQYVDYGVGRLIVIFKETGEILGWCGLKYHPETEEYDIGYRFHRRYWGKGYATESAIAVLKDGVDRMGIKEVVGRARVENKASIHVFDKLQMLFVEEFIEDDQNWVLYKVSF